jgi:septum formation protein
VPSPPLILASTSIYRRQLLDRFGLPYAVEAPGVDESPRPGEKPSSLAVRLARAKAEAVALLHPEAWVIGSDQVAEREGSALGKPGGHARAAAQLRDASGKVVRFHTAVCLHHAGSQQTFTHVDRTDVRFRDLDEATIERYLAAERPFDCAGSFKSEGLGIALFESIRNEDPTALVGLPLIALATMLREAGFELP